MRIGLDARTIFRTERRGTGRNLIDLYRHLAVARPDWQIVGYFRGDAAPDAPAIPNLTPRCVDLPGDRFDAWERLRLPMAAWRDGVDLLHCPSNTCPGWMPTPTV